MQNSQSASERIKERVVLGEDNVEDEVEYEALFEGQGVLQFRKR